jgi:hypothetical protein
MKRMHTIALLGLLGLATDVAPTRADVDVRVPFFRVYVGDGVYVRAPFVRVFAPRALAYYDEVPAQPGAETPQHQPPAETIVNPPMTHRDFARNFKGQGGNYEVAMINPVTRTAVHVRFTLPEGTTEHVSFGPRHVEFHYGSDHWVRIEFDARGATVTSR